ncbi:WGxxGxxG-CTERM domain-containing protein [Oscillatoria sp. FACHB-1407]|uniref:WGxxGxxG family protein n=1 Tax=Oscillatoria sp. FACHB-1407 TaxID=2692847 RepID=UPI001682C9FC|nr:WGxxGxxG family protein [Oscillatoria sp. FACHB-1407]MBD2460273.1 WGxxGxxG-CTERM domain-containing protein [Oscillatoria sp. FACHB-1407]
MQNAFLSKVLGASALTLSLTLFANLPASATAAPPTDTAPPVDATAPIDAPETTDSVETEVETEDDGFDWGWLGLLGLIGLAGLTRKNDDRVARYREPDEVGTGSGPRY